MDERRRAPRIKGPFQATWAGGPGNCLAMDLSLAGCYVNSVTAPAPDAPVVVSLISPQGKTLDLPGRVVYVNAAAGFAVQFVGVPAPEAAALAQWIAAATSTKV